VAFGRVKSRIASSLKGLYKTPKNKLYLELCNNLEVPLFGVVDGSIIYTNPKFEQSFRKDLDEDQLLKGGSVTYNNGSYSKQRLYLYEELAVFQLIKENTFNVPHNIMPHILLDEGGSVVKANAAFYKLLEIDQKSCHKEFFKYLDENSEESITGYMSNPKKLRKVESLEIKFDNKSNTTVLMSIVRVPDEELYHCYLVDITEYKNLEMHLAHSQKMQAIGQLSGGIAHDFNNLLTAMLGFCDLLLIKHPAGDPSFAEIMQIKQNANRAANLVRQLLALSRKQVLKPKILDITNTIAELASLLRRLVGSGIKLDIRHARDLNLVKVDQGQLEQVIINLVVNARDAINAVGAVGTISINTRNVSVKNADKIHRDLVAAVPNDKITAGRYVLIEVQDTGTGIPKKVKDKIFDPFFSTKDIGAGTGLGLSTVYGIINQISGFIYLDSEEGKGSAFYIYLKEFNDDQRGEEMITEIEDRLVQKDLTGEATILLVEDEAPVRMFSSSALKNKGYTVIEAQSGPEALDIMKSNGHEIDVIITDVMMPGMNGPSLISEIQKNYPKIKVVFISGYAEEAFSDAYGVDEDTDFNFLSKPFTLQQLASKVRDVLDMKVGS
jgi:two-component system, cell cycle sensor histidine kinase and response regulator CckA